MEEREEKKEAEPVKVKRKNSKAPFMIIGVIVIVALLVGGGIFAMKFFPASSEAAQPAETTTTETNTDGTPSATGIYYTFPDFITVLSPSEGYDFTYLKFKPELELSGQEVLAEVGTKLPALSAKIDAIMTDLDWDSVKTEKGREHQAEKLRKELNGLLESGEVVKVYFTSFVVQ